jgi:serine protease inhibitor ecotin
MDKTERIRLKNRRVCHISFVFITAIAPLLKSALYSNISVLTVIQAQQKLRDRMRQNVEVLETALEDCKKARLALQLERRALESQVGI